MKINKYQDIRGVVLKENVTEGRLVLIDEHSQSHNYGSREELPAVRVPANSTEAPRAKYMLTHAVDNTEAPFYDPMPAFQFALRQGFDQAQNVPFQAYVHMTPKSLKEGQVIASGSLALGFAAGVYTLPSGHYVDNASIVPGAYLIAANTNDDTTDAGKPKYSATATPIEVVYKDPSTGELTLRINY